MPERAWISEDGQIVAVWDLDRNAYFLTAPAGRAVEIPPAAALDLASFLGHQREPDELNRLRCDLADARRRAEHAETAAREFADTLGVIARGDARELAAPGSRRSRPIHRELAQTALDLHPGHETDDDDL